MQRWRPRLRASPVDLAVVLNVHESRLLVKDVHPGLEGLPDGRRHAPGLHADKRRVELELAIHPVEVRVGRVQLVARAVAHLVKCRARGVGDGYLADLIVEERVDLLTTMPGRGLGHECNA